MRVCGKGLPPGAVLLLGSNLILLCFLFPLLLTIALLNSFPLTHWYESVWMGIRFASIGLLFSMVFYYHDLYNLQVLRSRKETAWRLLQATAITLLLLSLFYAVAPFLSPGRESIVILLLVASITILISRYLALPSRQERVLVIAAPEDFFPLQETIANSSEWNLRIVQFMDAQAALAEAAWGDSYDCVIVCGRQPHHPLLIEKLLQLKMQGLRIEDSSHFYERTTGRIGVEELPPEWFVFSSGFENGKKKRIIKRYMDVIFAVILLVPAFPLMLLTALLVWIESGPPILFRQERVGLYGHPFQIYKFRTMRPDRHGEQPQWASHQNHRITKLGRFLRKFRLDELPQIFNVLRGDMSLVGPRPEQPFFCQKLEAEIPYYNQRHSIPPGLTGWAQVRYHYGASIEESKRKLEYDLFYVKHLSVALDLAILVETVKVVLVGRGAK